MARVSAAIKAIDKRIDEVYRRRCNGITIPLFDIPKIYKAGHAAAASGADVEQAVVDFVETIRVK